MRKYFALGLMAIGLILVGLDRPEDEVSLIPMLGGLLFIVNLILVFVFFAIDASKKYPKDQRKAEAKAKPDTPRKKLGPPLDVQLETLATCGIGLAPGQSIKLLLRNFTLQDFEKEPYTNLLMALGGTLKTGIEDTYNPNNFITTNLWHFDLERIEDDEDYAFIARRLSVMAQGDFPVENVVSTFNPEEETVTLGFSLQGQKYNWEPKFNYDWVDGEVLEKFGSLLHQVNSEKRFVIIDTKGGQSSVLAVLNEEQIKCLENLSLKVEILESKKGV